MSLPSSFFSTAISSFFSSVDESLLRSALCVTSVAFPSFSTDLSSLMEVSKAGALSLFASSLFCSLSLSEASSFFASSLFCSLSLSEASSFFASSLFRSLSLSEASSFFASSFFSTVASFSSKRPWLFASSGFSSSLLAKEGSLNKNEIDKAAINVALIILLLFIYSPYPLLNIFLTC